MKEFKIEKVVIILLAVYLVVPQALSYSNYQNTGEERTDAIGLVAFLCSLHMSTTGGLQMSLFNLSAIAYAIIFFGLESLFIYQVIRYCQEEAGKGGTIVLGVATLMPLLILVTIPDVLRGIPLLAIPLPTTLIAGLVMMRVVGPKEPSTPWEYD